MANILNQDGISIIVFGSEQSALTEKSLAPVANQIIGIIKTTDPALFVFDLSQVDSIEHHFIQFLVKTWKQSKRQNGDIALVGMNVDCLKVLERLKVEALWQRFETRGEAIKALKKQE